MVERLLTMDEAAGRLAVAPSTFKRLVARGALELVRPTVRAPRVRESDLNRYIQSLVRAEGEETA